MLPFSWFSTSLSLSLTKNTSSLSLSHLLLFQQQLSAPSPWPSWESSACSRWPGPWRGARDGRWKVEAGAETDEAAAAARRAAEAGAVSSPLEEFFSFLPRIFSFFPLDACFVVML